MYVQLQMELYNDLTFPKVRHLVYKIEYFLDLDTVDKQYDNSYCGITVQPAEEGMRKIEEITLSNLSSVFWQKSTPFPCKVSTRPSSRRVLGVYHARTSRSLCSLE